MSLIFGKYEIIRRLAVGGMGEIFLARETGVVDRLVILKSLLPSLAEDATSIDMFFDEARVAATLNHPNIIAIYEVGRWEGTYFIAMEYVDGENLGVLIATANKAGIAIPYPVAARIVHDAAIGLDFAHHASAPDGTSLRIVHRDVSPQNVMVRSDGVTKVVDFGIAMAANRASLTATGVVKGKLGYMPPEQIVGEELDARSDQFSLGVVFWELVTGMRLFKRDRNDLEIARRIVTDEVPFPSTVTKTEFPRELDAIIMRMLSKHRDSRFPRCREVAAALSDYLHDHAREGSHEQIASVVHTVIGEQLKARTADLTPSQPNFLISLSGRREAARSPKPERGGSAATASDAAFEAGTITGPRPAMPATLASLPPPEPRAATTAARSSFAPIVALGGALLLVAAASLVIAREAMSPELPIEPMSPSEVRVVSEGPAVATPPPPAADPEPQPPPLAAPPRIEDDPEEEGPPAAHERRRRAPRERDRDRDRDRAEAPKDDGFLTLKTTPWSKVYIDGQPYGSTPLFKVKLAPGKHELRLVNEQAGIDVKRSAAIQPGDTTKLNLDLEK